MAATKTPGTNTGKQGGIFQEIGPRGGSRPELHHGAGQPATAAHHATGEHLEAGENDARQQTLIGLGVGRRDAPDPFRPLVE